MTSEDFALLNAIADRLVVPDTGPAVRSDREPLSIRNMNQWLDGVAQLEATNVPLVVDRMNSRPVFVAVFDGTWNDRDDPSSPKTVPGLLSEELERLQKGNQALKIHYEAGVGTRVGWFRQLWQGATGSSTRERAEHAAAELQAYAKRMGQTPHVYAIGFSRGAASARHFLHLADPLLREARTQSLYLPHSFALLYETVAMGQFGALELDIPSTTLFVLQFEAEHERRVAFPLVNVITQRSQRVPGQNLVAVRLPGVHSDLGGGYGSGLEQLSLVLSRGILIKQGFALSSSTVDVQAVLNLGRHDSDWVFTGLANFARQLSGASGRDRLDPGVTPPVDNSTENIVMALLESSRLSIASRMHQLELAQAERSTANTARAILVQLSRTESGLQLISNCARHVEFDPVSFTLLLNGRPIERLKQQAVEELQLGQGWIFQILPKNPTNFMRAHLP